MNGNGDEEIARKEAQHDEKDEEEMTEAEKAMLAAKKRQAEEEAAALQDYEERRRIEREKEEAELKSLKERQERRRLEREEEDRQFEERRRLEEEARRQEEEEVKARMEADKRRKEEERKKRQQQLAGAFALATASGAGRNFVIYQKKGHKFTNICQAKHEMEMTKEQQKQEKENFMAAIAKTIDFTELKGNELKEKIRQLYQRICKLEADKYDLERRKERQEYDLKELNERQRQVFRNNARKKGIDPTDAVSSRYPPKILLLSKYEKQIDSRDFAERRAVFENKNAFPCFPNVPPPPTIYEKVVAPESSLKIQEKPGKRRLSIFEYAAHSTTDNDSQSPSKQINPLLEENEEEDDESEKKTSSSDENMQKHHIKRMLKYIVLEVLISAERAYFFAKGDCMDGNLPFEVTFNSHSKPVFNCMPVLCSNEMDMTVARCLIDWENIYCNRYHNRPSLKLKENCCKQTNRALSTLKRQGMLASGGIWRGGYIISKGRIVAFDFITNFTKRIDTGDDAIYEIIIRRVKCSITTRHLRGIKRSAIQNVIKPRWLRPVIDRGNFFHRRFLFWEESDRKNKVNYNIFSPVDNREQQWAKIYLPIFNNNIHSEFNSTSKDKRDNNLRYSSLMKKSNNIFVTRKRTPNHEYDDIAASTILPRRSTPHNTFMTIHKNNEEVSSANSISRHSDSVVLSENGGLFPSMSERSSNQSSLQTNSFPNTSTSFSCNVEVMHRIFHTPTMIAFPKSSNFIRPIKMIMYGSRNHPVRKIDISAHRYPRLIRHKITNMKNEM